MCEDDEVGLIESILSGLFVILMLYALFKILGLLFKVVFELLSLTINGGLYLLAVCSNGFDLNKVRNSSMGSFEQRQEMANGLSILLIIGLLFAAVFASQGNSTVQASPKYSVPQAYSQKSQVIVTALKLNARQEPNTSSKVLFQLDRGTRLPVKLNRGNWALIEYSGTKAWVHSNYLKVTSNYANSE